MPIKKAAKKHMRVTKRRTEINRKIKGTFRSAIKKTREMVSVGKIKDAQAEFKKAVKTLDKAVQKKVIKKNTASRTKSRLNKLIKKALKK